MISKERRRIYFLGIGGIGMSALARYYQSRGAEVSGYDLTPSFLTRQLENEGMAIHYEDNPTLIPAHIDLAIYTPAIPNDLNELNVIRQRGITLIKRSEALGEISKEHFTIAMAGTHGKTTTTAMVAHILHDNGIETTAFIGGIAKNFMSNFHLSPSKDSILVVEADEYDRSFLRLHPDIAIINSIDADHLDIYGDKEHLAVSFNDFAALATQNVIVKQGLDIRNAGKEMFFGTDATCDFRIDGIQSKGGSSTFNIIENGAKTPVALPLAGLHNIMNATAAFAAARQIGISAGDIARALQGFKGVLRRFDIRVNNGKHCYIDDYAHHPEEIKSCLSAIRNAFPDKRITLVFQPHLFTRTRDFMEDFANSLAMADELILLDIYPAREKPIEGITSEALLERVPMKYKQVCKKEDLLQLVESKRPTLLVTMGAGNIDRLVEPLEKQIATW